MFTKREILKRMKKAVGRKSIKLYDSLDVKVTSKNTLLSISVISTKGS